MLRPVATRLLAVKTDHLARNSIAIMATTVGNSLVGYFFWLVAARAFEADRVGAASAVISAATVGAALSDVGLRTTMMQELPQVRDKHAWSSRVSVALALVCATSSLAGIATFLALRTISVQVRQSLDGLWPLAVVALTIMMAVASLLDGVAQAERSSGQIFIRSVAASIGKLLLLLLLLGFGLRSSQMLFAVTALGFGISVLLGLTVQIRAASPQWRFSLRDSSEASRAVRGSMFKHYLLNLGGWLPPFIIPLLVVARLSTEQNAYLTFTWLIGGVFFMVSPAVASSLFVQGRWAPEDLRDTTLKAIKLIAILLTPIAVFLLVAGRYILGMFGSDYARYGYPLLVILVLSAIPDAITNVRIGQLRAQRRLAHGARLNFGMAIVTVGGTWLFLPHFGIVGAGLAWLLAQSCGALWVTLNFVQIRRAASDAFAEPLAVKLDPAPERR